ncbi:MAG: hypothetical protein GC146_02635 [Limimaricola sp.]|uniref:TadE/TadG family type IV pilus assembly protein n=1 Tax=Limimaricola sp. TaxID=2211665 RepID=UPI001E0C9F18|nr:hypothetical protein [Limimaricola sp.]MBI1416096.1 hypothetical protein [Limimaricola sp.]
MFARLLHNLIARLRDDEGGSIAVEAILMFPVLAWCYMATYIWFDAYRTQTTVLKSAYTVSDMLSRETQPITNTYLDSVWKVQKMLAHAGRNPKMRITEIERNYNDNTSDPNDSRVFNVVWSQTRGGAPVLTDTRLKELRDQIPTMPPGEKAILVETWSPYEPIMSVGLNAMVFQNFIITRPRFASQLCWSSKNSNWSPSDLTC